MSDDKKKSTVPNVAKKMDPKEQARISAMIANSKADSTQIISNESGKTYTLEKMGVPEPGQALDLKKIPTVYFKGVTKGQYTIDHRTNKVFIEGCKDCTFIINGKLLTNTIELWRCENVVLQTNTKVKTLQLDISKNIAVQYSSIDEFQCIVWQNVDILDLSFKASPEYDVKSGWEDVEQKYPDSKIDIDQFIVRVLPDLGEGLITERCCRLKNGFLSTDREAEDWERRNTLAKEKHLADFLKQGGIHLNKDENSNKQKPNEKCACGSGLKFKKCCMNKKAISGLAEGERELTFKDEAKK